jgi:O-antigen ligase
MIILDYLIFGALLLFSFVLPWTPFYDLRWHGVELFNSILYALFVLWELKLIWLYALDKLHLKFSPFEKWMGVFLLVNFLSVTLAFCKYAAVMEFSFMVRAFLVYVIVAYNAQSIIKYTMLYLTALLSAFIMAGLFIMESFDMPLTSLQWHQILILVSSYLIIFVPMVFIWCLGGKKWFLKAIGLLLGLYFILGSCLTYKRSILVALGISLGLMALALMNRYKKSVLVFGVIVIVFLGVLSQVPVITEKFMPKLQMEDLASSFSYRNLLNQTSFKIIKTFPWFGVGPGNYSYAFPYFASKELSTYYICCDAHNFFLQIIAETGFWGFIAFVMILLSLIKTLWNKILKPGKLTSRSLMILGIFFGLVANLVLQSFEYTWFYFPNLCTFWLLFGIMSGILKTEGEIYG